MVTYRVVCILPSEVEMTATLRSHLIPFRMAKVVKQKTAHAVEDAGKGEHSFTAGGVQPVSVGLSHPRDPAVLLFGTEMPARPCSWLLYS